VCSPSDAVAPTSHCAASESWGAAHTGLTVCLLSWCPSMLVQAAALRSAPRADSRYLISSRHTVVRNHAHVRSIHYMYTTMTFKLPTGAGLIASCPHHLRLLGRPLTTVPHGMHTGASHLVSGSRRAFHSCDMHVQNHTVLPSHSAMPQAMHMLPSHSSQSCKHRVAKAGGRYGLRG
jgi:hypothetical protein